MPWRSTTAAWPGTKRRKTIEPSRILPKPSASIPSTPAPCAIAASLSRPRKKSTRRFRIIAKQSCSTPSTLWLSRAASGRLGRQGDCDRAIHDFTEAIKLNVQDPIVYHGRGNAWKAKKELDKAIQDYTEAIRLDPKFKLAFHSRGLAEYRKKNYDRAIQDFTDVIRLDPKYASAFLNRGLAWYGKKVYERAVLDFNAAIRFDPRDAAAFNDRGTAWYGEKKFDRAIQDYNEAIRLNSKDASAFLNRALAWEAKRDYNRAPRGLRRSDPARSQVRGRLHRRGLAHGGLPERFAGNGKKAVAYATKGCELTEWKDASALAVLAAACCRERAIRGRDQVAEEGSRRFRLRQAIRRKARERLKLFEQHQAYREK